MFCNRAKSNRRYCLHQETYGAIEQSMAATQPSFFLLRQPAIRLSSPKDHNIDRFRLLHGFRGISSFGRQVAMISTLSMLRFFAWNPLDHACLVSGWKRRSIGVWANSLNLARLMSNVRQWWHVRALFAELSCSYLQDARPQTVLVENPKTLDEKGKLVSLSLTLWP